MKVLICISHVPDTTSKIRFTDDDTKFDQKDIQYIVGPHEELALTRLLDLKDAKVEMNITAVTVGLKDSEPTIRKALAMGADQAIRVDVEPLDASFVAKQIAEVFKSGEYDIVITGKESIDYNGGQVAGMIAEYLDLPSVDSASKFEVDGDNITLEREADGGKEIIKGALPMVVSSGKGFAIEPRIPNMRGIMMARKKKLNVVPAVDQATYTKVIKHFLPEPKGACKMVAADNIDELVRLLHEEAKAI